MTRVLVVGSDHRSSDNVVRRLRDAGHDVATCFSGPEAKLCRGVDGRCPIDDEIPDVAVVAHPEGAPEPGDLPTALRLQGASCALRVRVPVVIAGLSPEPFRGHTRATAPDLDALVPLVEQIAAGPLDEHSALATDALRRHLVDHPELERARVDVRRLHGTLHVRIVIPEGSTPEGLATQWVVSALRRYDPHATGIDVVVSHT